jgi:hypothetical protein
MSIEITEGRKTRVATFSSPCHIRRVWVPGVIRDPQPSAYFIRIRSIAIVKTNLILTSVFYGYVHVVLNGEH